MPGPSESNVACEPGCYLVVLGVREEEVVHGDDVLDGGAVRRGQAGHHARGLHSPQAHWISKSRMMGEPCIPSWDVQCPHGLETSPRTHAGHLVQAVLLGGCFPFPSLWINLLETSLHLSSSSHLYYTLVLESPQTAWLLESPQAMHPEWQPFRSDRLVRWDLFAHLCVMFVKVEGQECVRIVGAELAAVQRSSLQPRTRGGRKQSADAGGPRVRMSRTAA